jgi:hypothetical protein
VRDLRRHAAERLQPRAPTAFFFLAPHGRRVLHREDVRAFSIADGDRGDDEVEPAAFHAKRARRLRGKERANFGIGERQPHAIERGVHADRDTVAADDRDSLGERVEHRLEAAMRVEQLPLERLVLLLEARRDPLELVERVGEQARGSSVDRHRWLLVIAAAAACKPGARWGSTVLSHGIP